MTAYFWWGLVAGNIFADIVWVLARIYWSKKRIHKL